MIRGVNITVLFLHSPGIHDFIVDGGAVLQSQLIKLKVQPSCFQVDLCIERSSEGQSTRQHESLAT